MNRTDIYAELVYEMVVKKQMYTTEQGLDGCYLIFDTSIGKFLGKHPDKDYWAYDVFRDFLIKVAHDIARRANGLAPKPNSPLRPTVEWAHVAEATNQSFEFYKEDCKKVLEEVRKEGSMQKRHIMGELCAVSLAQLAEQSDAAPALMTR